MTIQPSPVLTGGKRTQQSTGASVWRLEGLWELRDRHVLAICHCRRTGVSLKREKCCYTLDGTKWRLFPRYKNLLGREIPTNDWNNPWKEYRNLYQTRFRSIPEIVPIGPFSHLHYNTIQRLLETISCNCEVLASTSLTSMIAFIVMQMRNIELSVKSAFKIYSDLSGDLNKYLSGRSGLA